MIHTSDGGYTKIINENGGDNSFESTRIGKPQVTKLVVTFQGSGAITDILFDSASECIVEEIENFDTFLAGDEVTVLSAGVSVTAHKVDGKDGPLVPAVAMIFDSSAPTGGDLDLGTPNQDFGGPGIGVAGENGSLFPNTEALGNVLIISEDENAAAPNDNRWGGVLTFDFDPPRNVYSMGHMDNEGKW